MTIVVEGWTVVALEGSTTGSAVGNSVRVVKDVVIVVLFWTMTETKREVEVTNVVMILLEIHDVREENEAVTS